jgi:hypothetical protein
LFLCPPHLVRRLAQMAGDVKFVKDNLAVSVWQVLAAE